MQNAESGRGRSGLPLRLWFGSIKAALAGEKPWLGRFALTVQADARSHHERAPASEAFTLPHGLPFLVGHATLHAHALHVDGGFAGTDVAGFETLAGLSLMAAVAGGAHGISGSGIHHFTQSHRRALSGSIVI